MWNYGPYGMMGGWDGWFAPVHGLFWLLLLVLVAFALVRLVRGPLHAGGHVSSPGLSALDERYARGEIGRDEYLQKKRDIAG